VEEEPHILMEMPQPLAEKLEYSLEDRPRFETIVESRNVKLMSKLLQRQSTPKIMRGVEIDELQKKKISNKKTKVLNL
jgi:hypothetical protein